MKTKSIKEGDYIGQNYVSSIGEAVRVLIERLRSLFQPTMALTEVLIGKPTLIHQISEYGFTGLTLSDVVKASS